MFSDGCGARTVQVLTDSSTFKGAVFDLDWGLRLYSPLPLEGRAGEGVVR